MRDFESLTAYLDSLATPRVFWWRDDDAGINASELMRLLDLRRRLDVPLVVSTVPAWLTLECRSLLANTEGTFVAQHGFDHSDHAALGQKSVELGGTAAPDWVIERIEQGRQWLGTGDISNLLALMVPPWNRLSESVLAALPTLGFLSISTFVKDQRGLLYGLKHVNCHVDPILWREGKRPMTATELTAETIKQLTEGHERPTGLLTHHLDMAATDYALMEAYLGILAKHPMIEFRSPTTLFGQFA